MPSKAVLSTKEDRQPRRCGCISRVAGRQRVAMLLSASGLGTRAECEQLIVQRRVTLNGRIVRKIAARPSMDDLS